MIMATQLLICDWLQFHCTHGVWDKDVLSQTTNYKVIDLHHGTRVFAQTFKIYEKAAITRSHRDEPLATIAMSPYSSVMAPNMCIVKIENKVLYQELPYNRVIAMINQLDLVYGGITRIDLAVDMHGFENGWDPLKLLREYRRNRVIKCGSRRYSQWLTAPFSPSHVNGVITADILSEEHITHCVSWGGANSDVHVKMYNKSKEIREESDKQYIASWHRRNGLDRSRDVWRVELSVQRRSRHLYDKELERSVPINLDCALKPAFQVEVFTALAYRHFRFKVAEVGKSMRNAPSLQLFGFDEIGVFVPCAPESRPAAGRTAKVCANFLDKLAATTDWSELPAFCRYPRELLELASEALNTLYAGLSARQTVRERKDITLMNKLRDDMLWLQQWNIVPRVIEGVPFDDIISYYDSLANKQCLLEDLALRRDDVERALNAMLADDIE